MGRDQFDCGRLGGEVTMLKGGSSEVKAFADHVIAERGVRYGHVVFMPADLGPKPA